MRKTFIFCMKREKRKNGSLSVQFFSGKFLGVNISIVLEKKAILKKGKNTKSCKQSSKLSEIIFSSVYETDADVYLYTNIQNF